MPRKARESLVRCPNPKCGVPLVLDDGGIIPWHTLSVGVYELKPVCPAVGEKFQPAGKERA